MDFVEEAARAFKIKLMWDKAFDGLDKAIDTAMTENNWEKEKSARAFQAGFTFALALLNREERINKGK